MALLSTSRRGAFPRLLLLLVAWAPAPWAWSQTAWQSGGSDANWSNASNWANGLPSNDGTTTVIFSDAGSTAPVLDTNWNVYGVTFDSTAQLYTIANSGSTLTIGAGGITDNQSAGTETIAALLNFNSGVTSAISVVSGGTLWLQGGSGSGDLTKTGAGTLQFTTAGFTTYSGTLSVNAGTVHLTTGGAHAFDNATINLNGGSLTTTITTPFVGALEGSGNLSLNKSSNGAAVTYSFGQNNRSTTYSGALSGSGGVIKAGTGTMTLSGSSTYTGATQVNAGTLLVNGALGNTSAVTVASGATLGGSGSVGGPTTLASGGTLAADSLTFTNGVTLNSGAVLGFDLGTSSDLVTVSGGTLTGPASGAVTINLANAGGFTAATYTLFDFSGATTSSFDASDFTLGSTISGYTYQLSLSGSTLQLVATASAVPEPGTAAAILGACATALVALRRRCRAAF